MARAFTLVELMVAIAVLIVIAALVLPSLDSLSESSRFKNACDQLSSAASVCRAEAKRTGKPVAVVATMNEDGSQSIMSVPLGEVAHLAELEEDTSVEVDSRVLMVMPKGVSIKADSQQAKSGREEGEREEAALNIEAADAETTQSLIIYWADGGATASAPMVVTGPGGRSAGAKVNSWTGTLSIAEPAADAVETASAEDEQPEEAAEEELVPASAGTGRTLHFEEFTSDP
jgi:Tfp pilus assembly protein FimT